MVCYVTYDVSSRIIKTHFTYCVIISWQFLHSNFLGAAAPIPNETQTEWTINACLGENAFDMFSTSDLAYVVRECNVRINAFVQHVVN